jgi:4-hydroxybenzoate polyprenyltransferase
VGGDPETAQGSVRLSASGRVRVVIVWILVVLACVAGVGLVLILPTSSKTVGLVYGAF